MAQYRAVIQGNRGEASRLGNKASGITSHTDGWRSGVAVYGRHYAGADEFQVYMTGGSNGAISERLVGKVVLIDGKPAWEPAEGA